MSDQIFISKNQNCDTQLYWLIQACWGGCYELFCLAHRLSYYTDAVHRILRWHASCNPLCLSESSFIFN